jgi:HK97 family phage portal protein
MPWRWPWTRTHDRALFNIGDVPVVQSWAGVSVTPDTALRLSTVWGCVRLLADSVSTLPLAVYRDDDRDPLPTPRLLARPSADHPELSDWLWSVMGALLTRGNCWGMISDRAGAGLLPAQVDLLDPDRVGVQEDRDAPPLIRVDGQEVDRAELFHVKAYPRAGSILGMSPISYAKESVGLGLAAERFGAQFFGEGAVPSGVIESDQRLDREAAENLVATWMMRHQGRHKPAVLGGAKYRNITIAPEEAQFVETQRFNVSTICRCFGIPPAMMGGETAGHEDYSSPEMRSTEMLVWVLRPWLHRLERAISSQLLPRTQRARFNASAMVRADLKTRYEAHAIALASGFLTVNEVRELEDRPPLPEGGAIA